MLTISGVLSNPVESASSLSSTITTSLNDSYPGLSKQLTDGYSTLSSKFNGGLTTTRSTIETTVSTAYGMPGTFYSYVTMFVPVDPEEKEVTRTSPNENLGENVIKLSAEREEIVNNILDLYSCKPSKECFKHYTNDVIFEDSLIYAIGLETLKASFYGMPKIFEKSNTVSYKILENTPNTLKIDLNQKYTLPYVRRAFVQHCVIVLQLEGDKIVRHSDLWSGKPIISYESILPLRKGVASLVKFMFKIPEI
jgi:hypothetical protein